MSVTISTFLPFGDWHHAAMEVPVISSAPNMNRKIIFGISPS